MASDYAPIMAQFLGMRGPKKGEPAEAINVDIAGKISGEEQAMEFAEDFAKYISEKAQEGTTVQIINFDISRNNGLVPSALEKIFNTLRDYTPKVKRVCAFKVPNIDNEICGYISEWLDVVANDSDNAPKEIHLSDCRIESEGFAILMASLEGAEVWSSRNLLYMRIENNYIDKDSLQEKVDSGLIALTKKGGKVTSDTAKCEMRLNNSGIVDQKEGDVPEPPAPDAPNPPPPRGERKWDGSQGSWGDKKESWKKDSWDNKKDSWGKKSWEDKSDSWGSKKDSWQDKKESWGDQKESWGKKQDSWGDKKDSWEGKKESWGNQQDSWGDKKNSWGEKKDSWGEKKDSWGDKNQPSGKPQPSGNNKPSQVKKPKATGFGQPEASLKMLGVQTAASKKTQEKARSRSPRKAVPDGEDDDKLPPGWTKQFSDEYQIPYFWHDERGEAVWEKPTA